MATRSWHLRASHRARAGPGCVFWPYSVSGTLGCSGQPYPRSMRCRAQRAGTHQCRGLARRLARTRKRGGVALGVTEQPRRDTDRDNKRQVWYCEALQCDNVTFVMGVNKICSSSCLVPGSADCYRHFTSRNLPNLLRHRPGYSKLCSR